MRTLTGTVLAAFALVVFATAGCPVSVMSGKDAIDKRIAHMKKTS